MLKMTEKLDFPTFDTLVKRCSLSCTLQRKLFKWGNWQMKGQQNHKRAREYKMITKGQQNIDHS